MACALALVACSGAPRGTHRAADVVLRGGQVITMDPAAPQATAVAIAGQRIVAVGGDGDVRDWIGPDTRVIELGEHTVTPGLVDSHCHLYGLGKSLEEVSLRGLASEEAAAARVAEAAASVAADEWVTGRGWDQNLWPGQKFPTAASLDRVAPGRLIAVRRVDGHALWASSAALAAVGIGVATPDPAGGRIVRDKAGRPTGVLVDNAMDLVEGHIPEPSAAVRRRRILAAAKVAAAAGFTAVHEMGIDDDTVRVYRGLADEHRLPLRVYAYLAGSPALAEQLAGRVADIDRAGTALFVLRGIKLFADGALGSRGARLLAPYSDEPASTGLWVTEPAVLSRATVAASEAGFQVAVHAIGDAAVRATLDAFEEAHRTVAGDLRSRVEHAQVVAPDDVARFHSLGVIASMQPTHATSDMGWAEARLGPERIRGAYAWHTMLASGAHVVSGSDFPVEDVSAVLGLHAAITRQDADGKPPGGWYPAERMTLDEALRSYTVEPAYAAFADGQRGQIKVGMVADLTVFDRSLAADTLLATQIVMTLVNGRVAYEQD